MYWVLVEILKKQKFPFYCNFYVNCLFFPSGPLPSTPGELIASQLKAQAYVIRNPLAAQLLCFNFLYHVTVKSALAMRRV